MALPNVENVALAKFKVLDGTQKNTEIPVQFNPVSLDYTLSNEFDSAQGSNATSQNVKKTTGKLSMTLQFDTSDTGHDVREKTQPVAQFLQPSKNGSKKVAPRVEFSWGSFVLIGVIEQYKETLDFFAANGLPLRAAINLTLSEQKVNFERATGAAMNAPADPVFTAPALSPSQAANLSGNPAAARDVAQSSGAESLRAPSAQGLSVGANASASLSAAANFSASAAAGVSLGGGLSGGLSGSLGTGTSGGLSASAGVSLSATAGSAFANLRLAPPTVSVSLESARATLLSAPLGGGVSSFSLGGQAQVRACGSLSANVGAEADLHSRLSFGF